MAHAHFSMVCCGGWALVGFRLAGLWPTVTSEFQAKDDEGTAVCLFSFACSWLEESLLLSANSSQSVGAASSSATTGEVSTAKLLGAAHVSVPAVALGLAVAVSVVGAGFFGFSLVAVEEDPVEEKALSPFANVLFRSHEVLGPS